MPFTKWIITSLLLLSLPLSLSAREPEIIICAQAGDLGCVKKQVKKDKRSLFIADKDGNTVLIVAAARGANSIISYVANEWPDWRTNNNGANALHMAVAANHADTVNLIIAFVKDDPDINFERFINARDTQNGATPLHLAAARCNRQLYAYLVKRGAKTDTIDFSGRTPPAVLALCKNTPKDSKPKTAPNKKGKTARLKNSTSSATAGTQAAPAAQTHTTKTFSSK